MHCGALHSYKYVCINKLCNRRIIANKPRVVIYIFVGIAKINERLTHFQILVAAHISVVCGCQEMWAYQGSSPIKHTHNKMLLRFYTLSAFAYTICCDRCSIINLDFLPCVCPLKIFAWINQRNEKWQIGAYK